MRWRGLRRAGEDRGEGGGGSVRASFARHAGARPRRTPHSLSAATDTDTEGQREREREREIQAQKGE